MKSDTQVVGPIKDTRGDIVPLPALPSEQVRQFIRASKAENTLRGYSADWRDFCGWSEAHAVSPLPATPEAVAAYIAECASHLKPGSIQRRLNAIADPHHSRQPLGPQDPGRPGIPGRPSARPTSLHADLFFVAESGRTLVRQDRTGSHRPRHLHFGPRSGSETAPLHQCSLRSRAAHPVEALRPHPPHAY